MTRKCRELRLETVLSSEFDELFDCVKQGIFEHVDNVFGWDDEFQRYRLSNDYQPSWFHWVYKGSQKVGLTCFKPYDNAYHVHLLIIFPQHQSQNIGQQVMMLIQNKARIEQRKQVTLSSFRDNTRAIQFYEALGYQVVDDSDEDFVSYRLKIEVSL
ncbi:GNAT family N-acetyltransferase [Vibrio chagasii]|uniref:GNAT family N-acetyltransferase n=1 Tax=Vibrio chagasii TaxID=170679 RepID=A0A7Y4DRQ5_9VIBR|nr:GNAT family N-acetyltransferase [Vibrio chagasii]NOH33562.1 GNAT family N-acetyltransferase [Vibrio chagasii]